MSFSDGNGLLRGLFTAAFFFSGCATGVVASEEKITIKGSNTFGEELAPALIEQFRKTHADVNVSLESKGSESGIAAILDNQCDIASSSRALTEDERRLARSRGIALNDYLIGFYGVAVVVNAKNPVSALSDKQVCDIFTGAITNWKQVGSTDDPITLYIRDQVSGTYKGFQELAMERKPYAQSAKMLQRYAEIVAAVKEDVAGIGYTSMGLSEQKGITAVRINRIAPDVMTVNRGDYPYSRALRLYTRKDGQSLAARAFVQFAIPRSGQDVLSQRGFVRRLEQSLWPMYEW
jgi:phosphate transport system substrate-binding protein